MESSRSSATGRLTIEWSRFDGPGPSRVKGWCDHAHGWRSGRRRTCSYCDSGDILRGSICMARSPVLCKAISINYYLITLSSQKLACGKMFSLGLSFPPHTVKRTQWKRVQGTVREVIFLSSKGHALMLHVYDRKSSTEEIHASVWSGFDMAVAKLVGCSNFVICRPSPAGARQGRS